jgi:predicted nucleotidyltransferase|tara:strand:- start:5046 stop:6107 length:1062 start_codon:yes stop_codon:yes gene_type:complete
MANKTKEDKILDTFEKSMDKLGKENSKKVGKIKTKINLNIKKQSKKKKPQKNIEKIKKSIKTNKELKEKIKPKEELKITKPKKIPRKVKIIKNTQTLRLRTESDIAMDFATKIYQRFNKLIKSIILFGSVSKKTSVPGSDIDIIIILDDASVKWDQELIVWYREELGKITTANPYKKNLHINTIKLTTWFQDLLRGDPVVINIIRDGESLIDFGGFFEPLKYLLASGKIKSTPEAIYSLLQRAPIHISRSKVSELNAIEGLFWAMVDSAHAALIAAHKVPPSPEHVPIELKENFVDSGKLKMKYVLWYRDLFLLHKKIAHGEITNLKGVEIDEWQDRTEEFLKMMAKLVNDLI